MYKSIRKKVWAFHENEDGNMTLVNVMVVAWLLLMFAFNFNSQRIIETRTKTQLAADVAAASVGDKAADNMKELVALNHTIGTLLSKVLIHESWGGPGLDSGTAADTEKYDKQLSRAHETYILAAQLAGLPPQDLAFEIVNKEVIASEISTEFDVKTRLKEYLTFVYQIKSQGYLLVATKFPPFVVVGKALHTAIHLVELKIYQEYQTANAVHKVMSALVLPKTLVRDRLLPSLKRQTEQIVERFPDVAKKYAEESTRSVDRDLSVAVIGADGEPQLPVEIDPLAKAIELPILEELKEESSLSKIQGLETTISRDQVMKVTQLARSTFPWVVYDREPLLKAFKISMTLSEAKKRYKHHTEGYSKRVISDLQLNNDMGLYVLKRHSINKGYQMWTEDAELADELFSYVVVVQEEAPTVIGRPIVFNQHNPNGLFSAAQVTLYNGNLQKRNASHIDLTVKRIRPNLQPVVGYDTMGWTEPQNELIAKTDQGPAPIPRQPKYELNWQSKLEPVSNVMYQAVNQNQKVLPAEMQSIAKDYFVERPDELLIQ